MRRSTWIAIGIAAAVAAWLASGLVIREDEEEEVASAAIPQPMLVEVRPSAAEAVPQYIYAQGVAQPYRTADVISSTGGTLADVEVREGDEVEAGAVLAQVRPEARESELASAEAQVETLETDLAAMRELAAQGFTTPARVRELSSQLESARAALERARTDIRDTTVEAPIPGIVSDVFVNSGQVAPSGTSIARIIDNTPLRVMVDISQRDIGRVDVGREAVVSFATGDLAMGRICYVAPAADADTHTFRVEIRVPNEEREVPSVISAGVRFQTGEAQAHFVSPAILALSEAGELGVKSVDAEDMVRFHAVEIVQAGMDGAWVAGLPEELRLITTGQGFVREGERVRTREAQEEGDAWQDVPGRAPLPTSAVEDEEFEGAEELAEPPPAEELCRGAAAHAIATGAVPVDGGAASGAGSETQPGGPLPGGAAARDTQATDSEAEPGAAPTEPAPAAPPISPGIQSPPVEQQTPQLPQMPEGAGQHQDQSGVGDSPDAGTGGAEGGAP